MILWTTSLALATVSPGALLQAEIDGLTVELPALETDLRAHIDGDIATVRLIQTFTNPDDEPISPRYVFPLPEDAAVYAMTLRTSTTVVTAEIARREEAEARFQQAARAGKQAAVLHQHRPNVFEQKVANLGPGETLSVELSYAQQIPREDGRYAFVAPLVVGPRFQPADADPTAPKLGQWAVGATAAAAPEKIDSERVKIEIVLDGGLPIQELSSPSHQVILGGEGAQRTVSLAKGRTIDNRDFVLNYTLTPEQLAVGSYAWAEEGRGVVALRIEPPTLVKPGSLTPREVVFVLDTSGSMRGFPMDASKRFMRRALQNLRPGDHFRIV
ncbi:MAG TPA: hypothetical protein ENK18_01230, partial [Deltaproteobacteria bacterium]|nr:hypothetical protein [Deltaproteobacteria bacterium]